MRFIKSVNDTKLINLRSKTYDSKIKVLTNRGCCASFSQPWRIAASDPKPPKAFVGEDIARFSIGMTG